MRGREKFFACAAVALLAISRSPGAEAGTCGAAIEAAKAEWRSLTKGNHAVAPGIRIDTSDGRHLTGSALNYAWVLIDRADSACDAGQDGVALDDIGQFNALIHPTSGRSSGG
jgi:hypothetical protein